MWNVERPIVWNREKSNAYRDVLNERVAQLATYGQPLYVTGQKAADELLTPEEQASYQEWKEQAFLDWVKTKRNG